jgi:4-hydroxybenzoyl-CoA thioesterase
MLTNRRPIRIEWGDCDPAGIVFYPRYFMMFDACTAHLLERGTGLNKLKLLQAYKFTGFPMVDTRARFVVPLRFGDDVTIESSITKVGTSSFEVRHAVLKGDVLAVEAEEVRVWVGSDLSDPMKMKAQPIPPTVADVMRGTSA